MGKRLIKVDFDNFENRDPVSTEELGVFIDDPERIPKGECWVKGKTAYAKIEEFFAKREPEKMYLGYNDVVYPQFRIQEIDVT